MFLLRLTATKRHNNIGLNVLLAFILASPEAGRWGPSHSVGGPTVVRMGIITIKNGHHHHMHAIDRKLSAPAQGASQQIFGHFGFYIIHYLAGLLGGRPVGPPAPAGGLTKINFSFILIR